MGKLRHAGRHRQIITCAQSKVGSCSKIAIRFIEFCRGDNKIVSRPAQGRIHSRADSTAGMATKAAVKPLAKTEDTAP